MYVYIYIYIYVSENGQTRKRAYRDLNLVVVCVYIYVSENGQTRESAYCNQHTYTSAYTNTHLGNIRHKVIRNSRGILSDFAARMRANRIEVTQIDNLPLWVCLGNVTQHFLDEELCAAVWVGAAQGEVLLFVFVY